MHHRSIVDPGNLHPATRLKADRSGVRVGDRVHTALEAAALMAKAYEIPEAFSSMALTR